MIDDCIWWNGIGEQLKISSNKLEYLNTVEAVLVNTSV
jgi:hypothetical protein